ncbi:hypothetical protein QAZ17_10905, partial [Glaesserella parasuis]
MRVRKWATHGRKIKKKKKRCELFAAVKLAQNGCRERQHNGATDGDRCCRSVQVAGRNATNV